MKRVIFVTGTPRQGKTYLTNRLVAEHSFVRLSVDEAYVEFIKTRCPMLYFDALRLYIGPHYDALLEHRDNYSKAHLGRAFDAEWRRYLATRIQDMALLHDSVAVDGYLLKCCDGECTQAVTTVTSVFVVSVEDRRYLFEGRKLSFDAVAALGT
jgi:hypothetical protein